MQRDADFSGFLGETMDLLSSGAAMVAFGVAIYVLVRADDAIGEVFA